MLNTDNTQVNIETQKSISMEFGAYLYAEKQLQRKGASSKLDHGKAYGSRHIGQR